MHRILALCALLATPSAAQQAQPFTAAEELINSLAIQSVIAGLLSPAAIEATIDATVEPGTAEELEVLSEVIAGELAVARVELELALTEAAAETFTAEELQALTEFYKTEIGTSIAAKTQPFVSSAMAAAEPEIQAAVQRIRDRLDALAE